MVVAQLRGAIFVKSDRMIGYFPKGDMISRTIAFDALDDVTHTFGFDLVRDYLTALNLYGCSLLERLK